MVAEEIKKGDLQTVPDKTENTNVESNMIK